MARAHLLRAAHLSAAGWQLTWRQTLTLVLVLLRSFAVFLRGRGAVLRHFSVVTAFGFVCGSQLMFSSPDISVSPSCSALLQSLSS